MKTVPKIIVVNLAGVVGVVVALFLVPPQTSSIFFAMVAAVILLLINFVVFVFPRIRNTPTSERNQSRGNQLLVLGLIFFLLALVVGWAGSRFIH